MFTVTKQKLCDVANTEVVVTIRQIVSAGLVATVGALIPPFGIAAASVTAYVYGRRLLTPRK